jgi:hypothetical protein
MCGFKFPIAASGTSYLVAHWSTRTYNEADMRILAGCLVVAVASAVLSPSSQDLHSRYGEPDRERFTARPGICLTVEYGSDHLACYALIEPPQPLAYREEHVPLMSSDSVTEILEDVAPTARRGKKTNTFVHVSGCNEVHMTDYENVSIMRSTHTCEPLSHDQDIRTAITFRRDNCPKSKILSPVTQP